jgi:alpha-tubulin suppressor-like RCC1 family protein
MDPNVIKLAMGAGGPSGPDYKLFSWGRATSGQLGTGNTTKVSSPVQVGALTNWSEVSGGENIFAVAVKTDGTLWSWGYNNNGQLGLGNINQYSSPVQVGSLTNWSKIACGYSHVISIKTDGTIWGWGANAEGQLGVGDNGARSSPSQVGSLTNWSKVACGNSHTIAIKTDGTLWAWGHNNYGQLGLGNTTFCSSPVQVGALTTWSNVACGRYHTIATKTDGTLWTWGRNGSGQLGLGDTTNRSSPVQVGSLTTWSKVSAPTRNNCSFAIKTGGTLWAWGDNYFGNLGLSDSINRSSPVQVGALTNWDTVSCGSSFCIALKTDGTLWSWGGGSGQVATDGCLGLGNTTAYSSPKQIGSLTDWQKVAVSCGRFAGFAIKS